MQVDFAASDRCSLGVEMELSLIDKTTGDLVDCGSALLAELGVGWPEGAHPRAKPELFESTIEIITGICGDVAEARSDLTHTLAEVRAVAAARNAAPICIGTHPFADWHDRMVSPDPRYHELIETMQWPARRLQIFGIHYHVGVRSAEKSIAFANALTYYLPLFLGLSASSPFWQGSDTGLASARTKIFEGLPTAGLPPQLRGWEEFEKFMGTLVTAEAIRTVREVWWDVRPHPRFGTVELRMCDGMNTMWEVAALAALAQSICHWLDESWNQDLRMSPPREWSLKENKWLAARYGLDADLIVDDQGHRRPCRQIITELVERLSPNADALGCAGELADVLRIVDEGPSTDRQRKFVADGGSQVEMMLWLVDELERDAV